MKHNFLRRSAKGFTLLELLVVIAIIGILSSIAVVSFNSARSKARDAKRIADSRAIQTAMTLYFDDHDYYPTKASFDLKNTTTPPGSLNDGATIYMQKLPGVGTADNPYTYAGLKGDGTTACVAESECTKFTFSFKLENPNKDIGAATSGKVCQVDAQGMSCP